MTGAVLFDSAVFIYALGGDHPYRAPCRRLLAAVRAGELAAETTSLVIQEVMHQRARRTGDRPAAAAIANDLTTVVPVHDVRRSDVRRASGLFRDVEGLDAADACHAAVALDRDIPTIVTPDGVFDAIAGIQRLDPADAATILAAER